MPLQLDVVGLVVDDMARSLAFYRMLSLAVPTDGDGQPHVEVALPGGLRIAWDTVETIRSFDPGWALILMMGAVAALTLASVTVYLREWVRHMGVAP